MIRLLACMALLMGLITGVTAQDPPQQEVPLKDIWLDEEHSYIYLGYDYENEKWQLTAVAWWKAYGVPTQQHYRFHDWEIYDGNLGWWRLMTNPNENGPNYQWFKPGVYDGSVNLCQCVKSFDIDTDWAMYIILGGPVYVRCSMSTGTDPITGEGEIYYYDEE